MKQYDCMILYHNYYSLQGLEDVRERIDKLKDYKVLLLASVSDKFSSAVIKQRDDEQIIFTTNQGKDIGGKLMLIDLAMKLYSHVPYMILLHDKQSHQKYSGGFEKERLFSILSPGVFGDIIRKFESGNNIGIICNNGVIRDEFDTNRKIFITTNTDILQEMTKKYGVETTDYSFVAGTMFAARTVIYFSFFKQHNPVAIRSTLEKGNVLDHDGGTVTHSWERVLCWIATAAGFKILGV